MIMRRLQMLYSGVQTANILKDIMPKCLEKKLFENMGENKYLNLYELPKIFIKCPWDNVNNINTYIRNEYMHISIIIE